MEPDDRRPDAGKKGALAQLGEHLLCKQRVVGSIPTGSTKRHGLCRAAGAGFDIQEEDKVCRLC